jgi:glycosyltransferase involved in cell wall biosynthesis
LAVELGIGKQVIFLGNISGVATLLQTLDIFVLNSHYEGMSNTLLEAMASGLAVIATSVGSNPELVTDGDSGILIPTDDETALMSALERLVADEVLRKRIGMSARQRIARHFSVDEMVNKYSDVYCRVCDNSSRNRQSSLNPSNQLDPSIANCTD